MALTQRRAIGPATVGAPAPATDVPKVEDPKPEPAAAPAEEPKPVDPVEVDTESADYKAGWDAGYAKGLEDGKAGETKPMPPAEPPKEPDATAGLPATATELLAAFPDDKGFCMDCLGENLTLAGANAKAVGLMRAQLAAERKARATAETKLAAETGSPAPVKLSGKPAAATDTNPEDPKSVAEAEWDADADARKGFSSKANYVAYRTAELSGRIRSMKIVTQ